MRREQIEGVVGEIWANVLDAEISDDTDFFEVGGHSFLAIQIIAMLDEALVTRIPVTVLFDHPVMADFVDAVTRHFEGEPVSG